MIEAKIQNTYDLCHSFCYDDRSFVARLVLVHVVLLLRFPPLSAGPAPGDPHLALQLARRTYAQLCFIRDLPARCAAAEGRSHVGQGGAAAFDSVVVAGSFPLHRLLCCEWAKGRCEAPRWAHS